MKYISFCIIAILSFISLSCQNDRTSANDSSKLELTELEEEFKSELDSYELKEYIIVRYTGLNIEYSDGTTRNEKRMTDDNGAVLEFYSLTGVINYMTYKGWHLEEVISHYPKSALYSQGANLVFSRPTTKSKLEVIVNNSIYK